MASLCVEFGWLPEDVWGMWWDDFSRIQDAIKRKAKAEKDAYRDAARKA